nr:hypothetical protein [Kibdelosporangium sp. MJ126-NF4]
MTRNLAAAIALAAAALVFAAVALTARDPRVPCPLIGSRSGISLEVDPAYGPRIGTARLTTCWNSACTTTSLKLSPSSTSVPMPCTPGGPDNACARMEPTSGKYSFAELANLPTSPVEVTVDLIDPTGVTLSSPRLVITPTLQSSGGPECGSPTPQGGLLVAANGALSEDL